MSLLASIRGPAEVKALAPEQLPLLAQEIRERLVAVTARNGGHIGPNLGVVELSIALHRVFGTPQDKFVFDVAHQGYVHKLLTGRNGADFDGIRTTGGLSGFLNREESLHDVFGAGHAGTALSAAVGLANARDRLGEDSHVVALIGDAALTCGVTMEALNNAAKSTKRLVIVLNDNEWSIDRNVGAVADILSRLIVTRPYNNSQQGLKRFLGKTRAGTKFLDFGRSFKRHVKNWFTHSSSLFEQYGVRYVGPIDGHDLGALERYLNFCKDSQGPILLHVRTEKGRGLGAALRNPEKFHGTGAFDPETGDSLASGAAGAPKAWQDVFGALLLREAKADSRVVGITAAMPSGTGLNQLKKELPAQYHDVGIAEEHATLFAAGAALMFPLLLATSIKHKSGEPVPGLPEHAAGQPAAEQRHRPRAATRLEIPQQRRPAEPVIDRIQQQRPGPVRQRLRALVCWRLHMILAHSHSHWPPDALL
jgi:1-deoxy-D-xylulose-5-phosphate synthase